MSRLTVPVLAAALSLGGFALAAPTPAAAQTDCHPSYYGCLPYYAGDALNCADIGYAQVGLVNVSDDPYNLDTLYRPGNGITCDGIG